MSKDNNLSAFDQGQQAGKSQTTPGPENPFLVGSAEHNNFEVGRRFGVANSAARLKPSAAAMTPDVDEEEN